MEGWNTWYDKLQKPSWTPSPGIIGLAWAFLYPLIFFSVGYALTLAFRKEISPWVLVPFGLNLLFNFAFSPIFMGQKSLPGALVDCVLLLLSIVWIMVAIYPHSKAIFYAQIPYVAWVAVATTVMTALNWLNRK